ncbi:hypothetical protein D1BOALGB6SA_4720 [Olavius sp. associated proteobacterium Delta 1]|nr:hypothetical protein D1BOALGB6SA_4720 [Olavius sp. associated proteobacterium Delta 1]
MFDVRRSSVSFSIKLAAFLRRVNFCSQRLRLYIKRVLPGLLEAGQVN